MKRLIEAVVIGLLLGLVVNLVSISLRLKDANETLTKISRTLECHLELCKIVESEK